MKKISRSFVCASFLFVQINILFAQERILYGIKFPKTYSTIKIAKGTDPKKEEWKLVLNDEFDSTHVNDNVWDYSPPWGPVPFMADKNRCDSSQNGICDCADKKNVIIGNGKVKLMIKNEQFMVKSSSWQADTFLESDGLPSKRMCQFSSGMIFSKKKYGPGKVEIRCKIPTVDGLWPAFGLFGECSQEVDVFEFVNERYKVSVEDGNRRLHLTYHRDATCGDSKTWSSHGSTLVDTIDYSKSFHTYAVEWDEYQITWTIDGKIKKVIYGLRKLHSKRSVDEKKVRPGKRYRLNTAMPLANNPMWVIASCGVTNYGNALHPLYRGKYPAELEVEYIKVWEKK